MRLVFFSFPKLIQQWKEKNPQTSEDLTWDEYDFSSQTDQMNYWSTSVKLSQQPWASGIISMADFYLIETGV